MKNLFKGLFIAAALVFAATSCEEKYEDTTPTDLNLTSLVSSERAEVGGNYQFTLTLGETEGYNRATFTFVGAKSFLEAGAYTPAAKDAAAAGNYVTGLTIINGVVAESGTINVTQSGADYTIDAKLLCAGKEISVKWAGAVTYEEVLPLMTLTSVSQVKHSLPDKEVLNIQFVESFDMATGNGKVVSIDFYTKDGLLPEGIYKAGTGKESEFIAGKDNSGDFGGQTYKWVDGSQLQTYVGWQSTATKIDNGLIIVSGRGKDKYEVEIITKELHAKYVGEIKLEKYEKPAPPSSGGDYVEFTNLLGAIDYSMFGGTLLGLYLATDGVEGSVENWQLSATGSGTLIQLEIFAEGGAIPAGTYSFKTVESWPAAGECKAGSQSGGSSWSTVKDGKVTLGGYLTDGTVTVAVDGGTYTITIDSSAIKAKYVGPISK